MSPNRVRKTTEKISVTAPNADTPTWATPAETLPTSLVMSSTCCRSVSTTLLDNAMKSLGGTVLRRSLDDVQAEIAVAEDAQRAAAKEARKRLREQRQAKTKEEIRAKIDELKAKLKRLRIGGGS